MIRVQQVKVPLKHDKQDILKKTAKVCGIKPEKIRTMEIVKQSLDARQKNQLFYVYTVDIEVEQETSLLKKNRSRNIMSASQKAYHFPKNGSQPLKKRPVIIGAGPAGLFCAYALAKAGFEPLVLERGKCVEERKEDVTRFWETGVLEPSSNVQFGEGGAGTFSDGKLNTLVKDPLGRNRMVLETFAEFGADSEILYVNKPHIGTDVLCDVIANLRQEILRLGGTFYFSRQVTGFEITQDSLTGIEVNGGEIIPADVAVLAIGHSARDTFYHLKDCGFSMEAKSFAVGFRVEHPQKMINRHQYHDADMKYLKPAAYKLTSNFENGRGVYSFCMCPGGYVVNASSEDGRLAVNGMSYHDRGSGNANSAIIVSVTPKDFGSKGPLAGVEFQRDLEKKAYELGNGKIPQQLYGDFIQGKTSTAYGDFKSMTKGSCTFADMSHMLSPELTGTWIQGMEQFSKYIPEYNRYDAILSGIESRTSSPVRIHRNEQFESNYSGVYPCGEGAGYAGGIMSAAMDGLKVAEAIAGRYHPQYES